jgi:hypothetical protein
MTGIGEHTRPRVWLDAPRVQPFCGREFAGDSEAFEALGVFREGAENRTRGAGAPHPAPVPGLSACLKSDGGPPGLPWRAASCRPEEYVCVAKALKFHRGLICSDAIAAGLEARLHVSQGWPTLQLSDRLQMQETLDFAIRSQILSRKF